MEIIEDCPQIIKDELTRIENEIIKELNLTINNNIQLIPGHSQIDKTASVMNFPIEFTRLDNHKKFFDAMRDELVKGLKIKTISEISGLKAIVNLIPIKLSYSVIAYFEFVGQDKKILVTGSLPQMGEKRLIK